MGGKYIQTPLSFSVAFNLYKNEAWPVILS